MGGVGSGMRRYHGIELGTWVGGAEFDGGRVELYATSVGDSGFSIAGTWRGVEGM